MKKLFFIFSISSILVAHIHARKVTFYNSGELTVRVNNKGIKPAQHESIEVTENNVLVQVSLPTYAGGPVADCLYELKLGVKNTAGYVDLAIRTQQQTKKTCEDLSLFVEEHALSSQGKRTIELKPHRK